jgi:uncharacterized protein
MRLTPWIATAAAVILLSLIGPAVRLLTDWWWFESVGYGPVFRTTVLTQAGLGLAAGLIAALVVGGSARLAARGYRPTGSLPAPARASGSVVGGGLHSVPARTGAGRALVQTSPLVAADLVTAVVALVSAAAAAGTWPEAMLFLYGGAFGWTDPVWQLDASFYVFDLGLLVTTLRWLVGLLVAALVVSAATYVALGTLRIQLAQQDGQLVATGVVLPPHVQRHLASLVAAVLATMALLSFLARYRLMYDQTGLVSGPGYAELRATLPLLTVEAVGTALAALGAVVAIRRGSAPGFGAVVVAVIALKGLTAAVPGLVQRFSVDPNELSREAAQIDDHVRATRFAFGLEAIEEHDLPGSNDLELADIERNDATIKNVRLWDHQPLLSAFSQVQEIRTYYGFFGVDNDRYMLPTGEGGALELRQLMLSPRELTVEALPVQARTWVNEAMTYTHGYGVAVGPVNEVGEQGLPELFVQDLPPKVRYPDVLGIDRPEIYYGEATDHPVLVNTKNPEFDYPSGDDNAYTRYAGRGGVVLGTLGRLAFAVRLGATEVLLSGDLTPDSKVLLYRNVLQRAQRIAPFLRYDGDPYMVIDQGRLVWVLDAYTVTDRFPYARAIRGVGNYARNSVKITMDAYDGHPTFWWVDPDDPIAVTWDRVFPGLFRPIEQMPASLRAHMRYPIDLFAVQSELFATYHMVEHQVFYNREDEWEIPSFDSGRMAPYFTVMRLPGEAREEFVLMLPFTPKGKPNLAAWLVARSDGERYGEVRVYRFPKDMMVYGPRMVVARINQDDEISEKLSLWNQQGSTVELGTLLVIPIEESLVYVQPLYLRAAQGSIPELKRVIVAYDDEIAMAPTLEEGLAKLFGTGQPPAPTSPGFSSGDAGSGLVIPGVTTVELVRQVGVHWDAVQAAAAAGDWATWGQHMATLGELLAALRAGVPDGVPPEPVVPAPAEPVVLPPGAP